MYERFTLLFVSVIANIMLHMYVYVNLLACMYHVSRYVSLLACLTWWYLSWPMQSEANSCKSWDGSAPAEIKIRIGSVETVSSENNFFKLKVGGEISLRPEEKKKKQNKKNTKRYFFNQKRWEKLLKVIFKTDM